MVQRDTLVAVQDKLVTLNDIVAEDKRVICILAVRLVHVLYDLRQ